MKLLIVEDDPEIASAIRAGLEQAGYFPEVCRDGARALRLASTMHFAAMVLDLMLPGLDGLNVCRRLRQERIQLPILILTAKSQVNDRVVGLEAGADDYLCKPFELSELLARVRALVRRDKCVKLGLIQIADLVIDTATHSVRRAGLSISLTPREYALLEALASYEGRPVTREAILERVWLNQDAVSNMVDVYVRSLRQKIDRDPKNRLIHTVYGVGYMLSPSAAPKSAHDSH